jgi:hypothetical protein
LLLLLLLLLSVVFGFENGYLLIIKKGDWWVVHILDLRECVLEDKVRNLWFRMNI